MKITASPRNTHGHGAVSHSAVQDFLVRESISRNSAQYLSAILVRTMES